MSLGLSPTPFEAEVIVRGKVFTKADLMRLRAFVAASLVEADGDASVLVELATGDGMKRKLESAQELEDFVVGTETDVRKVNIAGWSQARNRGITLSLPHSPASGVPGSGIINGDQEAWVAHTREKLRNLISEAQDQNWLGLQIGRQWDRAGPIWLMLTVPASYFLASRLADRLQTTSATPLPEWTSTALWLSFWFVGLVAMIVGFYWASQNYPELDLAMGRRKLQRIRRARVAGVATTLGLGVLASLIALMFPAVWNFLQRR